MTRTVNPAGTGLQLWDVTRMYVELYATWPSSTPSEVWTSEVISYRLPRSRLGGCLEGEVQVATMPGRLPAGFTASALPGQPVRCSLTGMDRLAQIIAVLPSGDEVVIYSGVIGTPRAAKPRLWQVPLIAPDSLRMQEFANSAASGTGGTGDPIYSTTVFTGPPTPAGIAPLTNQRRIFGVWSIPSTEYTPLMTFEAWWRMALQNNPMGEYGVGPNLVFTAGAPQFVASPLTYALDSRADALQSAGRSVPPYLTKIRRYVKGSPEFQPPTEDQVRPGGVPAFAPTRTAGVGGSITASVISEALAFDGQYNGATDGDVVLDPGSAPRGRLMEFYVPEFVGRLQDMTVSALVNLSLIVGPVKVFMRVVAFDLMGGQVVLLEDPRAAVAGQFTITVKADAKTLLACRYISFAVRLEGQSADAEGAATIAPGPASIRTEHDEYAVIYDAAPPGLDYPAITEEAWNFSLPGIHAGPLLVTALPDGSQEFAATVINADESGLWTDVQCGPLPYSTSPVDGSGRWKG